MATRHPAGDHVAMHHKDEGGGVNESRDECRFHSHSFRNLDAQQAQNLGQGGQCEAAEAEAGGAQGVV